MEYIIYADESEQKGAYYSNFYGGALIRSQNIDSIRETLLQAKTDLNLFSEVKWSKVTSQYLDKYSNLMDTFFDFVQDDLIKIRIMFTQNAHVPDSLNAYHREYGYYLLYYQFIKHAFGLSYSNQTNHPISVRIYLDKLPDTQEKNVLFKAHLASLQKTVSFRRAHIRIQEDQIAEVSSHEHPILQCLDVVLGAIQFRLNNKHLVKSEDSNRRGKKTIAKEKLYKQILGRIRRIYPHFNIGITTGTQGDRANYWRHPYRHWCFLPRHSTFDSTKTKS